MRASEDSAASLPSGVFGLIPEGSSLVGILVCDGSPTCGYSISSYYENGGGHPAEPVRSFKERPGIYTEELLKAVEARGVKLPPIYGLPMDDRDRTNEQIIADFDSFINSNLT